MKTSFYFVLWILIYPILGLFHISFIDNNAFMIALIAIWGLSWLLNRTMPETLTYERASEIMPILEDVYTRNVPSFKNRLSGEANIEAVTAVYFLVTLIVIALAIFNLGINDWFALVIFAFLTFGAISRSISLLKAKSKLKRNPTYEQCMEIAENTYKLDYTSYYDAHIGVSCSDMMPPKPKHYKAFRIFSIVMAVIALLLGIVYIVLGVNILLSQSLIEAEAIAVMYILYGSLAVYFGIKDFISCTRPQIRPTSNNNIQTS